MRPTAVRVRGRCASLARWRLSDTRTITVVAKVGSDVTGVVTNTAAVDSIDNVAGLPVSTTATTTVTSRAVLSMTKVALNDPVNAGGVALYQLVVTNDGPSDAQNVVVTDTLPVSTTYAGGDAACVRQWQRGRLHGWHAGGGSKPDAAGAGECEREPGGGHGHLRTWRRRAARRRR